jgi:hypothetical protein
MIEISRPIYIIDWLLIFKVLLLILFIFCTRRLVNLKVFGKKGRVVNNLSIRSPNENTKFNSLGLV